jgi:hypothetical protein
MTFRHNNIYLRTIKKEFPILITCRCWNKFIHSEVMQLFLIRGKVVPAVYLADKTGCGSAIDFRGLKPL